MKREQFLYARRMELFVLIFLQIGFSCSYKIFYMEDTCGLIASQPLMDIPLGTSGRNSSGILTAAHYPPHTWKILAEMNVTGFLGSERYFTYPRTMNCSVNLIPPRGYGIVLSIRYLTFRNAYCTDYLRFTSAHNNFTECVPRLNDETESGTYTFAETVMVTFNTEYRSYSDIASGFQLTFTAFNHTTSGICSGDDAFLCNNHNCIWKGLTCDRHNNCGDLSDESSFGETKCGYRRPNVQYFGVFFSLFILILTTSVACFCCCRRHRTLVYSGTVVHSPLTTASTGSVNYGTYRIMRYNGQQLVTPGVMAPNTYTYPIPPSQPTLYPPFGPVGSTGPMPGVPSPQPSPYPSSDTSGRPPSPPPPYTQKSSPK